MAFGRGNGRRDDRRGGDRGGRGGRDGYEQRDNSGALFENDRKKKDSHPDCRGQIMVDGRMYWISGWWKEAKKSGAEYLSLSVERQDDSRRRSHDRDRGERRHDDPRGRRDRNDDGDDDDRDRERSSRDDRKDRNERREPFDKKLDDEIPF